MPGLHLTPLWIYKKTLGAGMRIEYKRRSLGMGKLAKGSDGTGCHGNGTRLAELL